MKVSPLLVVLTRKHRLARAGPHSIFLQFDARLATEKYMADFRLEKPANCNQPSNDRNSRSQGTHPNTIVPR
jgi:hypothetical protein